MTTPHTTSVTLRYFAWLREKTGLTEEQIALPPDIATVADVLRWQAARGHPFAMAFEKPEAIRVALDHVHAKPASSIANVREIAFFPPVTGG